MDTAGYDGNGVKVAVVEGDRPDSFHNLPGSSSGTCTGLGGPKRCHCPTGFQGAHVRHVAGVIRSSTGAVSHGGIADSASTLFANWDAAVPSSACDGGSAFGLNSFESSWNWGIDQGARVFNWSEGSGAHGTTQTSWDRFLDYLATTVFHPTIVTVTHNQGYALSPTSWLRNGLVVGGSNDMGTNTRTDDVMYTGTRPVNPPVGTFGDDGWELPHLVAPAVAISTAGSAANTASVVDGTSFAAPHVAAIAADMIEMNPAILGWPSVIFSALMAGASGQVDEAEQGTWPLNLHDGFDDFDGAGQVNAVATHYALLFTNKVNHGNSPRSSAHDYGSICSASTPNNSWYSEVYTAQVGTGRTLRVVARIDAKATCTAGTLDSGTCTTDSVYPVFGLYIYQGATLVGSSGSFMNNYQIASELNSSTTKDYTIKMFLLGWPAGMTCTSFGLAWSSGFEE